jgi:hypothetical protein
MDSLPFRVKTEKRHIAYVNFLFEAYDGIGVVRTADPEDGVLEILVAPDYEDDFRRIAKAIGEELPFVVMGQ